MKIDLALDVEVEDLLVGRSSSLRSFESAKTPEAASAAADVVAGRLLLVVLVPMSLDASPELS